VLRIDGHAYSPTMLHRILHMAAVSSSFDQAEVSLKVVGELAISDRQINNLATKMGGQLAAARDEETARFRDQPLPRQSTAPTTPIDLAAVFTDGGRMRTRQPGAGPGVHQARWRETKNAAFHRMTSTTFASDPQAELPDCFRNQAYVEKLVHGLKGLKKQGCDEESGPGNTLAVNKSPLTETLAWQPKTTFRSCLSSLAGSGDFGPMMAAAADARGFFQADKQAFLGDGQAYNWTIQQRWFPTFVAIVDFVHAVEYLYEAAQAIHPDAETRWREYVRWTTACWQGRVGEVIDDLIRWRSEQEPFANDETPVATDPRRTVTSTITYLRNNRQRMDYPRYRRQGLPVTSSLAESLVKQINKRVKGTEMFWDDGASGEAILQLRAAVISDGEPLGNFVTTRPISPFSPRSRTAPLAIAP
jgi:hypothetical protein